MSETIPGAFKYSIARNGSYLVLSFLGDLKSSAISEFERCVEELKTGTEPLCTINFAGVEAIDTALIPRLIQLQKSLRDRPGSALRVCMLSKGIEKFLREKGAIRESECFPTLQAALLNLKNYAARQTIDALETIKAA